MEYLGISSALLPEGHEGTAAYEADITYGVGYEFGFDYLRDQLALLRVAGVFAGADCVIWRGQDFRFAVDHHRSKFLDQNLASHRLKSQ